MQNGLRLKRQLIFLGFFATVVPHTNAGVANTGKNNLAAWANQQNESDIQRINANSRVNRATYPSAMPIESPVSNPVKVSAVSSVYDNQIATYRPSYSTRVMYPKTSAQQAVTRTTQAAFINRSNEASNAVLTQNTIGTPTGNIPSQTVEQPTGSYNWVNNYLNVKRNSYQPQNNVPNTSPIRNVSYSPQAYSSTVNGSWLVYGQTTSAPPRLGNGQFYAHGPATIACVVEAAGRQNVPPALLLGIASKELGHNGQVVRNTNESRDNGHFQINDIHFRRGEMLQSIRLEDARDRGCYNAELAAWLLNKQLQRTDRSQDIFVRAAGYHSWTPSVNAVYKPDLIKYTFQWYQWLNSRAPKPTTTEELTTPNY